MGRGGYAEITLVTLEVVLQGIVIGQDVAGPTLKKFSKTASVKLRPLNYMKESQDNMVLKTEKTI